jgi:hypothetical protein
MASRSVFVLDITDFRPMNSRKPLEFLRWVTQGLRSGEDDDSRATAAAAMQSGASHGSDGIELVGVWYGVGISGHEQFRAFSMYECHGGWQGGWRRMMQLYQGVPEGLFLSAIDDLRFQARTVPLVGAPGCPTGEDIRSRSIYGPFAMIEFAEVRPGSALDYLAAVREERAPALDQHGHRLAGLYQVAFSSSAVCTLWTMDLDAHVGLLKARDAALGLDTEVEGDDRLIDWEHRRAGFLTGEAQERLLAAYPGPALSPP